MFCEGTYDEASKTMKLTGKFADPMTGKMTECRLVERDTDDNTRVMEMYGPDPSTQKEVKWMEVTYKRGASADKGKTS